MNPEKLVEKQSELQYLRHESARARHGLRAALRELGRTSGRTLNPLYWFRRHPAASTAVLAGTAAGFVLGSRLTAKMSRNSLPPDCAPVAHPVRTLVLSLGSTAASALVSGLLMRLALGPDGEHKPNEYADPDG
jgi:hypothetical protein